MQHRAAPKQVTKQRRRVRKAAVARNKRTAKRLADNRSQRQGADN